MNWKLFKEHLQANTELHVQFEYAASEFVQSNYHITEIKQAAITSVDCGGKLHSWTEIILQVMEPSTATHEPAMTTNKILHIIDITEHTFGFDAMATVKVEYNNNTFGTRQMPIAAISNDSANLTVHLANDTTQCKAIERGDSCGKPKIKLPLGAATACCSTEEGVCC